MAHTLTHWRFHLNEWVTDYLAHQAYLSDDKILERSHWSQKRKTRYGAEVVAMMDQSGEVKKLWRDFHINLKAARESVCISALFSFASFVVFGWIMLICLLYLGGSVLGLLRRILPSNLVCCYARGNFICTYSMIPYILSHDLINLPRFLPQIKQMALQDTHN